MIQDLLESIPHDQFETLSEDIKRSLDEHRKWMQKITVALVSKVPPEADEFVAEDAHLHCNFGRWLESILQDVLFHQGSFLEIKRQHEELHNTGRQLIVELKQSGNVNILLFEQFMQIQKDFFDLVLCLFESSVVNKHQFDPTTQLINRRSVNSVLANEKHRLSRTDDYYCCIALADIDSFKSVNDNWGHDVGDILLAHTARVFNDSVRRHDTVSRFGGEEFLFIFPEMTLDQASLVIERIRKKLADSRMECHGHTHKITASFGITQLCRFCDIDTSIKRADIAMYEAKGLGRNCSVSVNVADITPAKANQPMSDELLALIRQHSHKL